MRDKVIVAAVGDIIAGDSALHFGIGVRSLTEKKRIFLFEHVEEVFSEADVVFGNLETVLSDNLKNPAYDNLILRGSSNFVEQLKRAHFNILNIANNHIQQHGERELLNTIGLLRRNEINVIGIERLQPQVVTVRNTRLGFLGYSLRPEQYADKAIYSKEDEEQILAEATKAKDKVDCLVVSLHWGDEFVSFPASWQISFAHKLVDSGTSVVLGHHPHVLQRVETYNRGVIAYSLGNFVSDRCQKQARRTAILKLILDKSEVDYEIIPCKINRNYQPVMLKGEEKEKALNSINELSNLPILEEEEYRKAVENSIVAFRKEYRRFLMRNWHKYPVKSLMAVFHDFMLRRLRKSRAMK